MTQIDRNQEIRLLIQQRVLRRTLTDSEFRRMLIDNPKSALARELGVDVPDHIHVTVLPESDNHLFIVIPALPSTHDVDFIKQETGIGRLAQESPSGYGGQPISTGIERLANEDTAGYGGRPITTGIERLAAEGAAGYGSDPVGH